MTSHDTKLSPAERARRRALASLARLAGTSAALPFVASFAPATAFAQKKPARPRPRHRRHGPHRNPARAS